MVNMVYIDIYDGMILNPSRREGQRGPEGEGQDQTLVESLTLTLTLRLMYRV